MADNSTGNSAITLGDPVPWFSAPLIGDGAFNLHSAGKGHARLVNLGDAHERGDREAMAFTGNDLAHARTCPGFEKDLVAGASLGQQQCRWQRPDAGGTATGDLA